MLRKAFVSITLCAVLLLSPFVGLKVNALSADSISAPSAVLMESSGDSRADSVRNGIGACSENSKYYAIHDGARPLITVEEIERVVEAAFDTGAATLGTSVKDTIKVVDGFNIIESTPIRSQLRAVQTPQVFERDLYRFALENAGDNLINFTDDCSLIENMGGEVLVVKGNEENIKLTTPIDIVIAESILKSRQQG